MHLFQELPEKDRVPAAAELGFDAVEWIFPYAAQIGNLPDRTGPGTGELDLFWISERIEAKGYKGWIGLEYGPAKGQDSWDALAWASRYGYPVKPRVKSSFV
jgi:hydroxypyruvate isomerase